MASSWNGVVKNRKGQCQCLVDLATRPVCVFLLGCVLGTILTYIVHVNSTRSCHASNQDVFNAPVERVKVDPDYHQKIISIIHGGDAHVGGNRRPLQAFTSEELFHILMCERFDWNAFLQGSEVYRDMFEPYSSLFTSSHGLRHASVVSLMDSFHSILKEERSVETWEYCAAFRTNPTGSRRILHPKNIAILMVGIGYETDDAAQASIENKKMYAKRHGYSMYVLEELTGNRHPAWYKFSSALQRLSDHDFVWIVDVDTIITNMDQTLEDIINPAFDMIVGVDPNGYSNTGSMIIQSTDWSKLFLMYLWSVDTSERSQAVWDQSAFEHAISSHVFSSNPHLGDESLRLASHILFVGQEVFNADNRQLLDHIPFVVNFHAKAAGLGKMRALADVVSSTFG